MAVPSEPVVLDAIIGVHPEPPGVNVILIPATGTLPPCRVNAALTTASLPIVDCQTHAAVRLGGARIVVVVVFGVVVVVVDGIVVVVVDVCPDCETVINAVVVPLGP